MMYERDYGFQKAINSLLGLALEELSLQEILRRSLDIILAPPWLALESKGSVSLSRGDADTLEMLASRGLPGGLLRECGRIPFGRCLCGRAAASREIEFAECVDHRHDIRCEGITPHGHYCVPILFRNRMLGMINLYLKTGHRTTPDEIAFQGRLGAVEVVKRCAADLPALLVNEGEGRLVLEAWRGDGGVSLAVTDAGSGIAAENVDKVFDPLFTTKSATGGTGLGLSIARRIVAGHGGFIPIAPAQGVGTTVTITLPWTAEEP